MQRAFEQITLPAIHLTGLPIAADASRPDNAQHLAAAWRRFNKRLHAISNRVQRPQWLKFAVSFPAVARKYDYMPAVETTAITSPPPGLRMLSIPSMTYLRFIHRGSVQRLRETYYEIYKTILPQAAIAKLAAHECGFEHIEVYDRRFHWTDPNSQISIYLPISNNLDCATAIRL